MIENIELRNFKGFKKVSLPFCPFTLFAGLNGAGKSSMIQSLMLLRQSYQSDEFSVGSMTLNGPLVEIGTPGDLLFVDADTDEIGIKINHNGVEADFLYRLVKDEASRDEVVQIIERDSRNEASLGLIKGAPLLTGGGSFQYLCAERFGPRKSMPMSDGNVADFDLGKHGEYTLHFLKRYGNSLLLKRDSARYLKDVPERLIDQVDAWLQEVSPGAHLELEEVRAADLMLSGFSFDRTRDARTRTFRATNVGFGLSYALPVLTALLAAPQGSLVVIENPEAHMHPRGQTWLGQLCARAAADGVQVIVETHSDHVMDGVRIDVRSGILSHDKAVFHYFWRKDGETQVLTPNLDNEGRLSEWPEGFFDQHRRNTAALIRPRARG